MQPLQEDSSSSSAGSTSPSSLINLDYHHLDSINHHQHHQPDLLEFPTRVSRTITITKTFPSTMQFDSQQPITFSSPESSSAVSYSSPSAYTPSSHSVSSFNWITDTLSDPHILAPTAPDLTFSFLQSTNWRPVTPVHKTSSSNNSNNNSNNNNNNNVSSKTHDQKHLSRVARDATPTQDFTHKRPPSLNKEEDSEDYDDQHEKDRCFSTPPTSPMKSRSQTVKDTTPDQRTQKKQARPVSYMGINSPGSGTMLSTGSERLKPKKAFGFTLGSNGRLRSATTCLESQLDDVLSQRCNSSAFADHEHPPTTVYRLPPQSEPAAARSRTGLHYQKTRSRFSAFLSFLPTDQQPVGPSSTSTPSPITTSTTTTTNRNQRISQTEARPTTKLSSYGRSSINLLDRASISFSSSSFRSFNSSSFTHNTAPSPYVLSPPNSAKSTADSHYHPHHHHHQATIPSTTIAAAKSPPIKSSRSFLNLLSSKLK